MWVESASDICVTCLKGSVGNGTFVYFSNEIFILTIGKVNDVLSPSKVYSLNCVNHYISRVMFGSSKNLK